MRLSSVRRGVWIEESSLELGSLGFVLNGIDALADAAAAAVVFFFFTPGCAASRFVFVFCGRR